MPAALPRLAQLSRDGLVSLVLAASLLVLAVLSLIRPGTYLVPAFTGYLCFLLVGYAEAQLRAAPRSTPVILPPSHSDEWSASLMRLERIIAGLSEPLPARSYGATLH